MKFLCGSCRTKYQISDEKVRGKILTIRCKKCGAKILVRESLLREAEDGPAIAPVAETVGGSSASFPRTGGSAALDAAFEAGMERSVAGEADDMPTSIAPVPADAGLAGFEWYVAIDGQQHGPFAFAELVGKVARGEIQGRHYVWHDGMSGWTRVREMSDLAPHLPDSKAPKPQPPPPPPADRRGGNVVPLAGGASASNGAVVSAESAPALDGAPHDTEVQVPTEAISEVPADVDLESFLEASEDRTTRSEASVEPPEAPQEVTARPSSPPKTGGGTAPKTGSEETGIDAEDEDIFANVPRASVQELVQRESTKFFVAAAGVENESKKNRLGKFIGIGLFAAFSVFMGLWVSGVISISVPGVGNPFDRGQDKEETALVGSPDEEGNYGILLGEVGVESVGSERRNARRSRRKRPSGDEPSVLDDFGTQGYVQEDEGGDEGLRSRKEGDGAPAVELGVGGRLALPEDRGLTRLPEEVDLDIPPPDQTTLDPATIQRVVASRKSSIKSCYQESLRSKEKLSGGKLLVSLLVEPSGRVTRVRIKSASFQGSVVGRCIVKTLRKWRFPSFSGSAQEIELPFILQRGV